MGNAFDRKLLSQIGLLTGLGAVLPVAGTAEAGQVCTSTQCTETQTFSVVSSPNEVNEPGINPGDNTAHDPQTTTATFSQFDPSLGTLTKIDVSLASTLFGSISVSANSTSEVEPFAAGHTDWDATFSLTLPGSLGFSDSASDSTSCTQSQLPNAEPFCFNFGSPSFPVTFSDSSTASAVLDSYKGTGTFDATFGLDLTLTTAFTGTSPGSASGGGSATWDPPAIDGLTITFIFTPNPTVPEPGTLALLGLGAMAGLGFARRRSTPDG